MSNILIVSNTPSPNTLTLQKAVVEGVHSIDAQQDLRVKVPWDAHTDDVLWSDGIILGTTENFGYMSGAVKDFFERIYYPCLEKTEGKPVALFIKAGLDGQGAKTSVERILTGLKWKLIQPPVVLKGEYSAEFSDHCRELGMTMAAGMDAGIY